MIEWMKKHIKLIIVLLALSIVVFPCIIHILFKIEVRNDFFVAEWTAGELLLYYGSVLSFLGTVILGALALYQNHIIKEEADKKTAIIEQREHEKNMPRFEVSMVSRSGQNSKLKLSIMNITNNTANGIEVYNIHIIDEDDNNIWESNKKYAFNHINNSKIEYIELLNPCISIQNPILSMEMRCLDKYFEKHTYVIKGALEVIDGICTFKVSEI